VIKLPNELLPGNAAFAISCWVKIAGNHTTSDLSQTLIDLRGQYQISISYIQTNDADNPNAFSFYIYSGTTAAVVNTPNHTAKLNVWQHIVCNYGDNAMELYVDGALSGTNTSSPPNTITTYNNTIGKDYNVSLDRGWVNGNIDEVIFFKRKLTANEIKAIYDRQNSQSDIPEFYGPVSFSYDAVGKRTSRNAISLKKAKLINQHDTIMNGYLANTQKTSPGKDSLTYTDLDQRIRIYPNPTKGLLRTELSGLDPTLKAGIYLYNSSGNLLKQKVPATAIETIDLSSYPQGVYMMRITIGDKVSEWKIIKE
jgi:hypothetical protein